jgi:hypothetical protein
MCKQAQIEKLYSHICVNIEVLFLREENCLMAELKKDLTKNAQSPLAQLPRKTPPVSTPPDRGEESVPDVPKKEKPSPTSKLVVGYSYRFGPPFWTIASIVSLVVNLVLIVILLVVWMNTQKLIQSIGGAMNMGNFLLSGLYTNFEKMDRAHITTTIPVTAEIPVKFDLQLNQQTNVVLSQDVTINNALVTVRTGGMNITNALTTIVLPQGTNLPVFLNLTVPVDKTVPVSLNVQVDIPMEQTQLHEPFVGLQDVVSPFYCMLKPDALKADNQPLCK